jgi:hypothetical protein
MNFIKTISIEVQTQEDAERIQNYLKEHEFNFFYHKKIPGNMICAKSSLNL